MQTKIHSYYQTIAEGLPKRHGQVMNCLLESEFPLSRKQISIKSGLTLQSVCGRANELIKMGAIEVCSSVYDCETEREVETLGIPDKINEINDVRLKKKVSLNQMREYIDYLWDMRRTDIDVCNFNVWMEN